MAPATSAARRSRLAGALLRTQPDERLAELAGEGSDPAFEELVRRHRSNLVRFAESIAPPGYGDDVVQDSMLKARAALHRGDRPVFAKAWLFKIVRNNALNERRGWREHDQIDETIDGVEQPQQAVERRGEIRSLVLALNELPESQRQALVQRELEGRGHDEIASALETSPGAVRQLIHRARTTLRAGAGAVVPAALLRAAALGGGTTDQAAGGLAATGLGVGAAKLGLGALLATGAIVGGVEAGQEVGGDGTTGAPIVTEVNTASATTTAASASSAAAQETRRDREQSESSVLGAGTDRARQPSASASASPPPHFADRRHGEHPDVNREPGQQSAPEQGDGGGAAAGGGDAEGSGGHSGSADGGHSGASETTGGFEGAGGQPHGPDGPASG